MHPFFLLRTSRIDFNTHLHSLHFVRIFKNVRKITRNADKKGKVFPKGEELFFSNFLHKKQNKKAPFLITFSFDFLFILSNKISGAV